MQKKRQRSRWRRVAGSQMKKADGLVLLVVLLLTMSCNRNRIVCFSYRHTPVEGWEQQHSLSFTIDTVKETAWYDLYVSVRTTDAYPFQSLWLLVRQQLNKPDAVSVDTLACVVTDNQGNQYGHGLSIFQNTYCMKKIELKKGQTGTIQISHIMRRNILPGVSDLGVEIKKTKETSTETN